MLKQSVMKQTIKKLWVLPLAVAGMFFAACNHTEEVTKEDLTQYVEPRIGTAHCRYFHFAPGALPFGMAKPGPSTNGSLGNKWGWEATGYDYRDNTIEGFPCLHEFQVGGIVLMPTTGKLITQPGLPTDTVEKKGYRSFYSHDDEVVQPGYYSVLLKDYNVKAEVTATERVAFQRYVFPESKESHILFNIGNRQGESGAVNDAEVQIKDDGSIEGWVITEPEYVKKYQAGSNVPLYFCAVVDKQPKAVGSFIGDKVTADTKKVNGKGAGVYLTFDTKKDEAVTVKVGVSYTSVENARLNLETEAKTLTFDEAKKASHDTWQEYLSRITVETTRRDDKVKFYTGLYHAILGRGVASDVNGAYPKNDGTVGQIPMKDGKPAFRLYNTDAMWGAQWNLTQLWLLAYPERMNDFINSHLQIYKDCGWLADGVANSRFVSGVGTNQLSNMIVAAYMCGIRNYDVELAYEACLKNELEGKNRPMGAGKIDTELFVKHGYVPHKESGDGPDEAFAFSASHTLEYSYSAWTVAQFAKALGKEADYEKLMHLSKGWERIYDAETNFVRPKHEDGTFVDKFDPLEVWRGFQEGNAWQYTFYVPHDAKSLVAKVGADVFTSRLDSIFSQSQKMIFSGGTEVGAFAGLRTLYNQGNQPCLHTSWLFNEAGKPELTQKWVRAILDEFYGTEGIHGYGYGQDEDQGQLGAWFVMSSIGLFDVRGLTAADPTFALGSPLFDKITIRLSKDYYDGGTFTILTKNNSKENIYVHDYLLNGKALSTPYLPFHTLLKGGKMELTMDKK